MQRYLNTQLRHRPLVLPTKPWPDFVIHKHQFQKNIRKAKALCAVPESSKKNAQPQALYLNEPSKILMNVSSDRVYLPGGNQRFSFTANFLNKHEPLALSKIEQISRSCTSHSLLCYIKAQHSGGSNISEVIYSDVNNLVYKQMSNKCPYSGDEKKSFYKKFKSDYFQALITKEMLVLWVCLVGCLFVSVSISQYSVCMVERSCCFQTTQNTLNTASQPEDEHLYRTQTHRIETENQSHFLILQESQIIIQQTL